MADLAQTERLDASTDPQDIELRKRRALARARARKKAAEDGEKTFRITAPDGTKYEVTGTSQEGALAALKKHIGGEGMTHFGPDGAPQPGPEEMQRRQNEAHGINKRHEAQLRQQAAAILQEAGLPVEKTMAALGPGGTLARGAVDEFLLGFGDETNFGTGLTTAQEKAISDAGAVLYPTADTIGRLGGLGTGVAGLIKGGVTSTRLARTPKGMVGYGAFDGAAYGGVSGAGHAEPGQRLETGLKSAAVGGGIGGGVPLTLNMAGAGIRKLSDKIASHVGAPESQAKARVAAAMRSAGMGSDDVAAKLDDLGPEGAIIDTLGESGRGLARSAANVSPEARDGLMAFTEQRMAGQSDRITDTLLKAGRLDEVQTLDELTSAARAEAKPGIDAAYAEARALGKDIDLNAFGDLRELDAFEKAFKEGERLAFTRHRMAGNQDAPSALAVLDETKKVLDDWATPARGERPTNEQALMGEMAREVRQRVDGWMTEYSGARELARNLYSREDALRLVAEAAAPRAPADIERRIAAVAPEYRGDVSRGFATTKADQVETRRATPGMLSSVFDAPRQQQALAAALGPEANGVRTQLARERAFIDTHRALTGNSTTARQLAEMGATGAVGAGTGAYIGGDAQSAGAGVLAAMLARKTAGAGVRALTARQEAIVAPLLARSLTERAIPQGISQGDSLARLKHLLASYLATHSGGEVGATGP